MAQTLRIQALVLLISFQQIFSAGCMYGLFRTMIQTCAATFAGGPPSSA
jgi:hypothetical protein